MQPPFSLAIIDDEALARTRLRRLLAQCDFSCHVAEFCGCEDFLRHHQQSPFDIAIVDIELQDGDGLALARTLAQSQTAVIFATAYDSHALAAFELAAFDYLLKPFDAPRLASALARVNQRLSTPAAATKAPMRLCLPFASEHHLVPVHDLWFARAQANYVEIHTACTTYLLRTSLAGFLERVDAHQWLRIHRSLAVRLPCVVALRRGENGERILVLPDGRELTSSRSYREAVAAALEQTS